VCVCSVLRSSLLHRQPDLYCVDKSSKSPTHTRSRAARFKASAYNKQPILITLHAQAGCWKPTNLLYFGLTCALHLSVAQVTQVCESVTVQSSFVMSVRPPELGCNLKNISGLLNQKSSRDSPTQRATAGGKTNKTMTSNKRRGC